SARPRRTRAAALCDGRAHRRELTTFLRPIRLLILLLALALALVLALVRPLQGRAIRTARRHGAHVAKVVARPEPRRHRMFRPGDEAPVFGGRVVSYA